MRWVLIKGIRQDARHWDATPQTFVDEGWGTEVLAVDLPGAGAEHLRSATWRVEAMAADVRRRWLERTSGEGPVVLLGLSLGGMVAAAWARRHPTELAAVVLGNTSFGRLSPPWQRLQLANLPTLVEAVTTRDPAVRERRVLKLVSACDNDERLARLIARNDAFQAAQPFRRANLARQVLAGGWFMGPERLEVPTAVLSGARDGFVDPRCSDALAAHLRAPLFRHPHAGHELTIDAPRWLMETAGEWARTVVE